MGRWLRWHVRWAGSATKLRSSEARVLQYAMELYSHQRIVEPFKSATT